MARARKRHVQQEIEFRTWGGKRAGAGRKRRLRGDPLHRERPVLSKSRPVHVVLRVKKGVGRLRQGRAFRAIRRTLARCLGQDAFRVVHLSIQSSHLHFLVEANDQSALTKGMHRLTILAARALNRELDRTGKLFAFRYHATQIASLKQARHALSYVLNNWRRHREDVGCERAKTARLDPYSSAIAFDGWAGVGSFALPEGYEPLPVSKPRTWLLRLGWAQHGAIDPAECPGPIA